MRFERFLYLLTQQVFVETRSTIKNWWKQVAAKDLTTDGNLKPNLSKISKSQTGSLCSKIQESLESELHMVVLISST